MPVYPGAFRNFGLNDLASVVGLQARTDADQVADLANLQRHQADYAARQDAITALPETDRQKPPRKFEVIVARAAEWIDQSPPPHDTIGELAIGMSLRAPRASMHGGRASCTARNGSVTTSGTTWTCSRWSRTASQPQ